jgi:hypothetical protein
MTINIIRDDLLRLVQTISPPYGGDEYSDFTGHQHKDDWLWKSNAFDNFTDEKLWNFYIDRSKQSQSRKVKETEVQFAWPHHKGYNSRNDQ